MNKGEAPKDASANAGKSKLRYPLRSATKNKEEKQLSPKNLPHSSASKSGRSASSVSKSMSVVDFSGSKSAAKPPRRLSNPPKSTAGSASKPVGNITPASGTRARRSVTYSEGKSRTPISDVSKSFSRQKLSAASYWLSQIKLSENCAKHLISLGFFKLAFEAGPEDLQRMREELKAYVRRYNLVELGEPVKDVIDIYKITESLEQMQISETCSQVPDEAARSSDDEVHSSPKVETGGPKPKVGLRPKSSNPDPTVNDSRKKESIQKNTSASRTRGSSVRSSANLNAAVSEAKSRITVQKPQKPVKQAPIKGKSIVKNEGKVSADESSMDPLPTEESLLENKENMDAPQMEDAAVIA